MQSGSALAPWAMASNHREVVYQMAKMINCGTTTNTQEASSCEQHKNDAELYEGCLVDKMSSEQIVKCFKEASTENLIGLPFAFLVSFYWFSPIEWTAR